MESLHHLYEQESELWDISLCIAEFQQQLARYTQGMIMSSLSGFSILAGTICKQTLHETWYLI
jgi:hypothetical protein